MLHFLAQALKAVFYGLLLLLRQVLLQVANVLEVRLGLRRKVGEINIVIDLRVLLHVLRGVHHILVAVEKLKLVRGRVLQKVRVDLQDLVVDLPLQTLVLLVQQLLHFSL